MPIVVGLASFWSFNPKLGPKLFIICAALCKAKYDPCILWKTYDVRLAVAMLIIQLKILASAYSKI